MSSTRAVGPGAGGQIRPTSDTERVLGQIERGEVRADPDAAREIAARHEDAYGDVWKAQTAWHGLLAAARREAR